jgi:hypothetical protein
MSNYAKAIRSLRPDSEFVITGDDLENIEWHVIEGEIPTKAEILAAVKIVEKNEQNEIDKKESDRLSAIAKLAALGLTEDEVKAFIG